MSFVRKGSFVRGLVRGLSRPLVGPNGSVPQGVVLYGGKVVMYQGKPVTYNPRQGG